MDASTISWLVPLGCGLVAAYGYVRLRGEKARVDDLAGNADRLESELKTTRSQLEKRDASLDKISEQDADIRRKLDKAKRRAAKARDEQKHESEEVKQLQSQLRLREAELRSLRGELEGSSDFARGDIRAFADATRLKAQDEELSELRDQARRLTARAEKAEASAETTEASAVGHDDASAKSARELARVRHKLETHEKLYLAIQGELAAKKDRMRSMTEELERLRALKVVVVDPVEEAALPTAETSVESQLSIDLEPQKNSATSTGT